MTFYFLLFYTMFVIVINKKILFFLFKLSDKTIKHKYYFLGIFHVKNGCYWHLLMLF